MKISVTSYHTGSDLQANTSIHRPKLSARLFKVSGAELLPPLFLWIGLILLAVFSLGPFVYMLGSSLSQEQELLSGHLLPLKPTLDNYIRLFSANPNFFLALKNSLIVSLVTTAASMLIGTFAAYAFARFHFPFRLTALFIILAIQALPSTSILVPLYMMMRTGIEFGVPFTGIVFFRTPPLLDSLWSLIISYTTFSLPYVIWLLSGYLQKLPKEIEEASYVDGCSRLETMFKVNLPLTLPALAATSIFTLLGSWDQYMFANAFTQTYASKTLPVAIAEFIGKHSVDWGLMTAGGVLATLPPVVLSLFFYKHIVAGTAAGGVKE